MTGGPNTDIHILVLDSAAARPLAQSSANEAGARWSPDGARLIFARTDSTGSNLLVINSTGSGLRHRARLPGTLSWTTWCPDGKHAVFTTKENGNEDLYAVEVENARVKRLTDHPARDTAPSCAAGGRVVFASERVPKRQLFVLTIPE